MDDHQFARLLDVINGSWKGYRKVRKGVKKRVARHMQEIGCRRMEDYLEKISVNKATRAECERRMTVAISRFFRDRQMWAVLETRVLPEILASGCGAVRVWFAGCAGGEEVYSFRMLWEMFSAGRNAMPALGITATDLNPENLTRAQAGIYLRGAMREVDDKLRNAWFDPLKGGRFAVAPVLKDGIDWRLGDLRRDDPPGNGFDLVFLRNNLLTYYTEPEMRAGFNRIVDTLAPGGFLVIGAKEDMPGFGLMRLARFDRCVYRNPSKTHDMRAT